MLCDASLISFTAVHMRTSQSAQQGLLIAECVLGECSNAECMNAECTNAECMAAECMTAECVTKGLSHVSSKSCLVESLACVMCIMLTVGHS